MAANLEFLGWSLYTGLTVLWLDNSASLIEPFTIHQHIFHRSEVPNQSYAEELRQVCSHD
jgi:hypothetical protein